MPARTVPACRRVVTGVRGGTGSHSLGEAPARARSAPSGG